MLKNRCVGRPSAFVGGRQVEFFRSEIRGPRAMFDRTGIFPDFATPIVRNTVAA
jgi:hypothetical protein